MIIQHQQNVHEIKNEYGGGDDKKFNYLLLSDIHFDNKNCDRKLLKKHLDEIVALDGLVFIFGDWFDVMGCYKDPRSKAQDVKSEYIKEHKSYLDLVIQDAYEFLLPYKDHLAVMGEGNHESAIRKHRDTDVLFRLCHLLQQAGSKVTKGGYAGYVNFKYVWHGKGGRQRGVKLAYHHGHGGAKRSKGILNAQIDGFIYADADVIVSGHDHNKLLDPSNVRYRLTKGNEIIFTTQYWLKLGSYVQNDKTPLVGGWHTEKGFLPRKMGGWFMSHNILRHELQIEFKEAQ